ncbi:beta-ketoacyl-[acyl-carrier-protein] synthase family protein [Streptomyces sp. NPDC059651]|uniref:beta-ketoacyl-[acyl-carrier-protein] synthase family protein n=1 Tax=unclassified Streptomyces TaxID=2593676 RepID=UPI00367422D3
MSRDIVVTGIGAVTALGDGVAALYERSLRGESGLRDGEGRCSAFEPTKVLTRKEVHRTDRFSQFAIVACDEAVKQAGWDRGLPYRSERVMSIIGSGVGGIETAEQQMALMREQGPDYVSGLTVPMLMANAPAAQIAIRHGLHGEAYCVTSACASGAQAIGAGMRAIRSGEADAAIVGGAEASLSGFTRAAFLNAGAMSPTGESVPFAKDRDGFLMGEGAGILVLESAEGAAARGARPLGKVIGYGATCDAHHLTAPAQDGQAAVGAIRVALEDAGLEPGDIDYVNAHGTGTPMNDRLEIAALRTVFGDALASIPISSTKSCVGHLMGAAGAVEAIVTLRAVAAGVAPPTVGLCNPDDELEPLAHVHHATPLRAGGDGGHTAISTSFGFGGHNSVLILSGPERPER